MIRCFQFWLRKHIFITVSLICLYCNVLIHCLLLTLYKSAPHATGSFTWLTLRWLYRATTCLGRELNFGSHTYYFWSHEDMEGLPWWVISSMPGPPLRQHKHERLYTPGTHSVIRTRRIWKMIFGDLGGLKFPDICLTGEEKPRKKTHPGNLTWPGIEPGPAAWQARMQPLAPQRWTPLFIKFIYHKIKISERNKWTWLHNNRNRQPSETHPKTLDAIWPKMLKRL